MRHGGILLLNSLSGIHTYIVRDRAQGRCWPASVSATRRARATSSRSPRPIRGWATCRANPQRQAARARPPAACAPSGTEVLGMWSDGSAALTPPAARPGFRLFPWQHHLSGRLDRRVGRPRGLALRARPQAAATCSARCEQQRRGRPAHGPRQGGQRGDDPLDARVFARAASTIPSPAATFPPGSKAAPPPSR